METRLSKQNVIAALTRAVHAGSAGKRKKDEKLPKLTQDQKLAARLAKFTSFAPIGDASRREDEHFFAHLIAWNHQKGSVRDTQVALPVIGLGSADAELLENALAHFADLRPREFLRATEFARSRHTNMTKVRLLVERWLTDLERNYGEWERTAVLHRNTLMSLYARYHVKPAPFADDILFKKKYPPGSRFAQVRDLRTSSPQQIMGTIQKLKLPFLIVREAVGEKLKEPEVLAAVIGAMSPTELVTNMKALEKLGVKENAITRAALEKALENAATKVVKGRTVLLKASVAAEAQTDSVLAGKLQALQEKQIDTQQGIEGNWLICADKSASMAEGIEVGKEIAGVLTRFVRGKVWLLFYDNQPTPYEIAPGTTLEAIKAQTRHIVAGGGTEAENCLDWIREKKLTVDGIVVVGDGGENNAFAFKRAYEKYVSAQGNEPNVYFYKVKAGERYINGRDSLSNQVKMTVFDLRGGVDYTSLPTLVQTMRIGRFSLVDEIMATPLRTLNEVLDRTKELDVVKGVMA